MRAPSIAMFTPSEAATSSGTRMVEPAVNARGLHVGNTCQRRRDHIDRKFSSRLRPKRYFPHTKRAEDPIEHVVAHPACRTLPTRRPRS